MNRRPILETASDAQSTGGGSVNTSSVNGGDASGGSKFKRTSWNSLSSPAYVDTSEIVYSK